MNAAEKAQVLFLIGDREPVFDQLDPGAGEHAFELRHGAEELFVLVGVAKAHDLFYPGAVVPAAVEQDDFTRGRQV